jgi:hypothetical protein
VFKSKAKIELKKKIVIVFNKSITTYSEDNIVTIKQKKQDKKLLLVNISEDIKQQYLEQRVRNAYLASICQPEAAFNLATAAQAATPSAKNAIILNKRLHWQIDNLERGLYYIPLTLENVKLFLFVNGSFANNRNLSSQIGYIIVLGNELRNDSHFVLKDNIIY